jgi:regulator of cell morphogenesis and NO signaling
MIRELSEATGPTNFHCGSLANPISMMMLEHQHCDAILDALHETTGAYEVPDDACGSYRALYDGLAALEADTNLHIHKENDVLFPAVIAMEKRQLQ